MSINTRIKQLRHTLNLSQAAFAKDISISNGYIAGIELGKRPANERIMRLICLTYGVNQKWLEFGEGEMFSEPEKYNIKLKYALNMFEQLKPDFQQYVLKQLEDLLILQNKTKTEDSK